MSKSPSRRTTTKRPALPADVVAAVRAAADKKAEQLTVLDLRKAAGFTDFFVICTGTNIRQVQAIADAVEEKLKAQGLRPAHVEGYDRAEWILLDYFDFIVHVFMPDTREFYSLDRLWGNAARTEMATEVR